MDFVRKPIGMNLKLKLILLIEGIIIPVIFITGLITTIREKETLENELRKRGLALVGDLSKFITRPLLSNDLPNLRRFLNQTMEQDYVSYVIILDPDGKVVMHNDLAEVGKTYYDKLSLTAIRSNKPGYTDIHTAKDEELHCDMYMPIIISNLRLGTIRLGYSHLAIQEEIGKARRQIFTIGFLTALISGFAVYLLARYISSPIKRITEATGSVAQGHLNTNLSINRNDEIGVLASSFNRMTEDLQKTTVSKEYFDNIFRSINDTLLVVGPDSKIKSANKAAWELLEYKEEELIEMDMKSILPEQSSFYGEDLFISIQKVSFVANQETEYVTKTGRRIPMLFSAAMLKDKKGQIEGVVCIARDVTERKKAEDALKESEKELHFLSSQLMTVQEKERKRFSTELHDELGQSLLVLKLKMRSIQESLSEGQDTLKAECDNGIAYVNEVIENVRRLSRELSPSVLENLGLSAAVRWLVDAFAGHAKIVFTLNMENIDHLFSQEEEIIIYRMIQEILTNVVKHAEASLVSLTIQEEYDRVFFMFEDNGKGFNLRKTLSKDISSKGLGLSAMYERTRMLGGTLDIWSEEGQGTRISYFVPLRDEAGGG